MPDGDTSSNEDGLTKLAPGGGSLVYSIALGGTVTDIATAIAINATGAAYVTGYTSSQNFPIGPASVQSTFGGGYDAFVTKFDPTGATHVYSTWLGGGSYDQPNGIALDASKQAYVTGQTNSTTGLSPGAPLLPAGGGQYNGFLSVLNAGGTGLVYGSFIGGSANDTGWPSRSTRRAPRTWRDTRPRPRPRASR